MAIRAPDGANNEYAMLQKKNDVDEVNLDCKKRLEVYLKFVRLIFALKHKKTNNGRKLGDF